PSDSRTWTSPERPRPDRCATRRGPASAAGGPPPARDLHVSPRWSPRNRGAVIMTNVQQIREHMQVLGSCGGLIGRVDRAEGASIKLTKDSPNADGEHRYIPLAWVERVDQHVHLNRPCRDVQVEWQGHPVQEGDSV